MGADIHGVGSINTDCLQGSADLFVSKCNPSLLAAVHVDAYFMAVNGLVSTWDMFIGGRPGPQGAEGQTLIIRHRGATGLSPLVCCGASMTGGYRDKRARGVKR